MQETMPQVYFQDLNSCASDGGEAFQIGTTPLKVFIPGIYTGMKQACDMTCDGIDSSNVGAFMIIAGEARQGQVIQRRHASVFFSNDVIYFVTRIRVSLRDLTVFTASVCTGPDLFSKWPIHDGLIAGHLLQGSTCLGLHQS